MITRILDYFRNLFRRQPTFPPPGMDDYYGGPFTVPVIERVREQETPSAQFERRMERVAESMNSVPRVDQIDRDFYLVFGGD